MYALSATVTSRAGDLGNILDVAATFRAMASSLKPRLPYQHPGQATLPVLPAPLNLSGRNTSWVRLRIASAS